MAAETVRLEGQCTTGVFFLGKAEDVGSKSNLRLALLLAVAKVVVGEDGDHNAGLVSHGDLEGAALVVELELVGPAHTGGLLGLSGLADVGQAKILLPEGAKVRRQDNAASGAGPVLHVEGGIVLRKMRVTGIAKDTLDKVNVGHTSTGDEVTDLQTLLWHDTGHLGLDERTDEEADHGLDGIIPSTGVGQDLEVRGRVERSLEKTGIRHERDGNLIGRNGKAPVGNMKDALGRTTIVQGVVQNAISKTVRRDLLVVILVDGGIIGQGQLTGKTISVDVEDALTGSIVVLGESDLLAGALECHVDEILDTLIGRSEVARQQTRLWFASERGKQKEHTSEKENTRFDRDSDSSINLFASCNCELANCSVRQTRTSSMVRNFGREK